jgi:hypothetical protein
MIDLIISELSDSAPAQTDGDTCLYLLDDDTMFPDAEECRHAKHADDCSTLTVYPIIMISANFSISFLLNFSHTVDLLIAHRLLVHSSSKVRSFKQSHVGSLRQSHLLISHNSLTHEPMYPIVLLGPLNDKVRRYTLSMW